MGRSQVLFNRTKGRGRGRGGGAGGRGRGQRQRQADAASFTAAPSAKNSASTSPHDSQTRREDAADIILQMHDNATSLAISRIPVEEKGDNELLNWRDSSTLDVKSLSVCLQQMPLHETWRMPKHLLATLFVDGSIEQKRLLSEDRRISEEEEERDEEGDVALDELEHESEMPTVSPANEGKNPQESLLVASSSQLKEATQKSSGSYDPFAQQVHSSIGLVGTGTATIDKKVGILPTVSSSKAEDTGVWLGPNLRTDTFKSTGENSTESAVPPSAIDEDGLEDWLDQLIS
jgi:hypothetical protein